MRLTADVIMGIAVYAALGLLLAYFGALVWVQGQVNRLKENLSVAYLLPEAGPYPYRGFIFMIAWWSWTRTYRDVHDSALSRAVVTSRFLGIATLIAWAVLFLTTRAA